MRFLCRIPGLLYQVQWGQELDKSGKALSYDEKHYEEVWSPTKGAPYKAPTLDVSGMETLRPAENTSHNELEIGWGIQSRSTDLCQEEEHGRSKNVLR